MDSFAETIPPIELGSQQAAHCSLDEAKCDTAAMPVPDGPVSSSELQDTPLGHFLTLRAAAESVKERNVTVKVRVSLHALFSSDVRTAPTAYSKKKTTGVMMAHQRQPPPHRTCRDVAACMHA